MQDRHQQLFGWQKERPAIYNLGYFFNPQGFLTAVKQEVTRQNQISPPQPNSNETWSLDDVEDSTLVKDRNEKMRDNERGVLIRGLFLEGAKYSTKEGGKLDELGGKDTFIEMPIILVSAKVREKNSKGDIEMGTYLCPVYKYKQRTDKYFIFNVKLKCDNPAHHIWKLRGVALLCQKPL